MESTRPPVGKARMQKSSRSRSKPGYSIGVWIVASVAKMTGADPRLIRDARLLAAIGGVISPALLVADRECRLP